MTVSCERVKKTAEEQIKALLAKYSMPSLEVIIPILEKSERGQQELTTQVYDEIKSLAIGLKEILGLKDKNMRAVAKINEVMFSFEGQKFEPIELSDSKFSFSVSDCPMLHVGKNVSFDVKSKFCDLLCVGGSKAIIDVILGSNKATCTWNKALIKGLSKCTLVWELARDR